MACRARETVQALKQRGFVLSIITDTIYPLARKMRWLEKIGVAEFVDHVACSTELGVHKPDPAIYLGAVRQAGLTVDESAFVGHATDELAGARRVGMKTVAVFYGADARGGLLCRVAAGTARRADFREIRSMN